MNNKKTLLLIGLLFCLQLFVPAKMIIDHESILKNGAIYKFKAAPIDPTDPFRGEYITLSFKERSIAIPEDMKWEYSNDAFVVLTKDAEGFAKIASVFPTAPLSGDYFKCKVDFVESNKGYSTLFLDLPFNRYYMEESKAARTELEYREALRDSTAITYAAIAVLNGDAIISNVFIRDLPIGK